MLDCEIMLHRPVQPANRAELTLEVPDVGRVPPGGTRLRRTALYAKRELCTIDVGHAIEGNHGT